MRRVQQIMGMPISIDILKCDNKLVFDKAFAKLHDIDERFSTYKADSEVSKFASGKLKESELSAELVPVIKACRQAEKSTDGYFSAWATGRFDPSGYVKGWAITEAAKTIEGQGYKTYCIGAGGDILARSEEKKAWNIGIQDPRNKFKILNKLSIFNGAVCTSGNYERSDHIINPKSKKPAWELLSVTVTGPNIVTADILATAVFASGIANPEFLIRYPEYQVLSIAGEIVNNNIARTDP